jgi:hypothetical protein
MTRVSHTCCKRARPAPRPPSKGGPRLGRQSSVRVLHGVNHPAQIGPGASSSAALSAVPGSCADPRDRVGLADGSTWPHRQSWSHRVTMTALAEPPLSPARIPVSSLQTPQVVCVLFAAWWTRYLHSVFAADPAQIPLSLLFFRTKWLLSERCSATCPRRRRPGQVRHRQGRLQITAVLRGCRLDGGHDARRPVLGILCAHEPGGDRWLRRGGDGRRSG